MAERAAQLVVERRGQAVAFDVQTLQVGVEVLACAVHVLDTDVMTRRPVLAQLGQVGEHRHQFELVGQRTTAAVECGAPDGEVLVEQAHPVVRVDVEAEQLAAEVFLTAGGAFGGIDLELGRQLQVDGVGGHLLDGVVLVVGERFEAHQGRARLHLGADRHRALLDT